MPPASRWENLRLFPIFFVAAQQNVFKQPHEGAQALIALILGGVELGQGQALDMPRPGGIQETQEELGTEAEWLGVPGAGKKGDVEHVTIQVNDDPAGALGGGANLGE